METLNETAATEIPHSHDGVIAIRIPWWPLIAVAITLTVGWAWYASREEGNEFERKMSALEKDLTQRRLDEARTRVIVREEIALMVEESIADKAEADDKTDKVL